ncbi:putative small nuclear ribonucleo protein [Phaeoacremonium minimum UCRPA7]|uniref:Putative small nuclear ribonucleo protein n=1 Tax=Phaeoacremonium minimum (strain UCR-PA7) TaxID=1286976 RepID=R8BHX2_PHAM7|nr:putative small nuclear ribonucleo protein [Phaeoacremonium minimum UCRPA7]EON98928.1 putative small nuclear ribonucleo protein [Phaeoacremonium minimum UCRPA7]
MDELMAGFVTSADTGNEDLVIASRAALSEYCEKSQENLDRVCAALVRNLNNRQGQDRVVVPTLEIIAFMFYVGAFRRCTEIDYKNLCLLVQKSGYKTGNVRKLEACIKVYGGITGIAIHSDRTPLRTATLEERRAQGITEARKRLGALMMHPWPRVRSLVIDELWGLVSAEDGDAAERLKGVDWGKAEKGPIKALVEELTPPSATA